MIPNSFLIVLVLTLVCAEDVHKSDRSEFRKSFGKNCDDSYSLTCLKLDVISFVDRLSDNDDISVLPGVSLIREKSSAKVNNGEIVADVAREFPDDPNARVDAFVMRKLNGFLNEHSIKLNLPRAVQSYSVGSARKRGGGGGGGGKKGGDSGVGMMLAAGAMMKGMLMTLGLGAVAAIAGKALMAGLLSLVITAIVGLKSVTSGGGGHSTYEVIAKPVYTTSHSHSTSHEGWDGGYGGHGRSLADTPLPLALQPSYKPS